MLDVQVDTAARSGLPAAMWPSNIQQWTGVRQELRTVRSYAERHGTRVYAQQATGGFWVAVGL